MGKPYQTELGQIPATVRWALEQDVSELRRTLLREFGAQNLIAVGSGGSLVAASFAAMLHEAVTGRFANSPNTVRSYHPTIYQKHCCPIAKRARDKQRHS